MQTTTRSTPESIIHKQQNHKLSLSAWWVFGQSHIGNQINKKYQHIATKMCADHCGSHVTAEHAARKYFGTSRRFASEEAII